MSAAGMAADIWIPQQKKAFSAWVNSRLAERSMVLPRDKDLSEVFDDGLMLIPFVEILTGNKAQKHVAKPKMRIHKQENVQLAFNVLNSVDYHPDIHVEEILDDSEKMVLGFIWQLFLHFGSNDNAAELLAWVQERVNDKERYPNVKVTEFSKSWQDGKAFAALLDSFSPTIFNNDSVDQSEDDVVATKARALLNSVFDAALLKLDVPKLLDAEDLAGFAPDDKAIKMYVTLLKNAWAEKEEALLAAERAEAERRANMTKEDALAELDAALAKLAMVKNCPQCGFNLREYLEAEAAGHDQAAAADAADDA